ncbi:MAG TPA: hypothetical protein VF740_12490 [Candidatus Acidoferrum sp.]
MKEFVHLRVRISAVERSENFLGDGQTIDVSHDGAAILVDRDLDVGQTIKIRRGGVNLLGEETPIS